MGDRLADLAPIDIATWRRLCHPEDLQRSEALLQKVLAGEDAFYECETRMRHREGHWIWVLDRGKVVECDPQGRPLRMSGTHAEITEKKLAQERLERAAAIRGAILRCQSAFLRASDETGLLQETCAILVEARDYALVWIGLPQDDPEDPEDPVVPVAQAGRGSSYLEAMQAAGGDEWHRRSPADRAARSGRLQVSRDLEAEPASASWASKAREHGFAASVSVPLTGKSGLLALLNVHGTDPASFDAEECDLLNDFASNLALVLVNMRAARENERIGAALGRSALSTVKAIAKTVEKRDPYTSGHQERVAELAVAIAHRLGWQQDRIEGLRLGALIHDIGKIAVPAEILNRPGSLTDSEMAIIREHVRAGGEIVAQSEFPWPIRQMIEQHHERLDGSGYPLGLTADRIVDEAKVLAVADVVEAITSHRPYRPALGLERGLQEIARGRGRLYDPAAVDACTALIGEGYRFHHAA